MTTILVTKTALPAAFAHDYALLKIAPNLHEHLESSASRITALGRRTTEQTFELGDYLEDAATLLSEGTFAKWVKTRCNIAGRTASGYVSVYRNLSDFRDELVDLSVGPTVLFHIAHATREQIRKVIDHGQEHGRLRVSDVKDLLAEGKEGEDKPASPDVFASGGLKGLKALIALKTREGLKLFVARIRMICEIIEAALAKPRVIKDTLAQQIDDAATLARLELENLAMFIEPVDDPKRFASPVAFPKESPWGAVAEVLTMLGAKETWPKMAALRGWLEETVLPVLAWAISGERKPRWPLAPAAVDGDTAEVETVVVVKTEVDAAPNLAHASGDASRGASDARQPSLEQLAERFGTALEQARGGLMGVDRKVLGGRKPMKDVPPLAAQLATGDEVEMASDEPSIEDAASAATMAP